MPPVAETECVVPLESNTNAPSVNAIVEDDAVTVRRGTRSRSRSHSQPPQQQQQQAQPQPEAEPERYMTVAERRNANVARSNKRRAEEARKAAQSLAFVDLSDYDDVLCDLLLDSVYLGFRTHKMNDAFYKSPADALKNAKPFDPSAPVSWKNRQHILATDRSLMNSDVIAAVIVDLVREYVLDKKDMDQATAAFMRCIEKPGSIKSDNYPGASLKRSFQALKPFFRNRTAEQIAAFKEHAKRYIAMYHPNAGYEITSTSRYKSSGKTEACIKATQDFQPGDEIRHCVGVIAGLSEDDEDYLHNRDFSVMFSTKKDCNCLFLGPARFVNHDCDPNCKFFVTDRSNQICFKVVKEIHVGEELTTFYGKDYFGVGNAECLCATCERLQKGGFTPQNNLAKVLGDNDVEVPFMARLRKNQARTETWHYYQNKFFGETFGDAVTTAVVPLPTTSSIRCRVCEEELDEISIQGECPRCIRHMRIFGVPWPERKCKRDRAPNDARPIEVVIDRKALVPLPNTAKNASNARRKGRRADLNEHIRMAAHNRMVSPAAEAKRGRHRSRGRGRGRGSISNSSSARSSRSVTARRRAPSVSDGPSTYPSTVHTRESTPSEDDVDVLEGMEVIPEEVSDGSAIVTPRRTSGGGYLDVVLNPASEEEMDVDDPASDEEEEEEDTSDVPGRLVPDEHNIYAVFVNPQDPDCPYWWPAMVVPTEELDRLMPKPGPSQRVVAYFENRTFSAVAPSGMRLMVPGEEPFETFAKHPEFAHDKAVIRAMSFLDTGRCKGYQWPRWRHAARRFLLTEQQRNPRTEDGEEDEIAYMAPEGGVDDMEIDSAAPTGSSTPVDSAAVTEISTPVDSAAVTETSTPVDSAVVTETSTPMDSAVVTETSTPVDSAIATGTCTPSELSETGYERPSTPSRIDLAAVEARELQVRLELERIVREGIEVRRAREIAEAEQRYSERLARLSSGQAALEELIAGVLPSPVRHQTDASGVSADFQFREELLSLARAGVESVRARAAAADEESLAQRLLRIQALRGNGRENSLERMGTPRYPLPPILCPPDLGDHFPEPPPIVRPPGPALFQMLGKAEMHIAPAISYNLHILSLGIEADEAMARAAQSQQQTILEEDTNRGGEGSSLSPPPTTNSNTNRSSNKRRRENDDDEEEDSALSSENQLTSEHEREGPAAAKRARQDFAHTR